LPTTTSGELRKHRTLMRPEHPRVAQVDRPYLTDDVQRRSGTGAAIFFMTSQIFTP
jgi:hypothetical protein